MKVMMIGAHPDDVEFRSAGLARKLLKAGNQVRFLVLCNGSKGHHILSPEQTRQVRAAEAANVCRKLGLTGYDIWSDVEDCTLEATLANRQRLIREIRAFAPDLVLAHRTNDYHADHRAAGLLVQDASYMLIVPHECPEAPAMRSMPVILYFEDRFTSPTPFRPDVVVDIGREIDDKIIAMAQSPSQLFEWLPYSYGEQIPVPESEEARIAFLRRAIRPDLSDEEVLRAPKTQYALRSARTAVRFRRELIEQYGEEAGSRVRFAEAFALSEYGRQPSREELLSMLCV